MHPSACLDSLGQACFAHGSRGVAKCKSIVRFTTFTQSSFIDLYSKKELIYIQFIKI
jgi:hypothetical protein